MNKKQLSVVNLETGLIHSWLKSSENWHVLPQLNMFLKIYGEKQTIKISARQDYHFLLGMDCNDFSDAKAQV